MNVAFMVVSVWVEGWVEGGGWRVGFGSYGRAIYFLCVFLILFPEVMEMK
jgi:hypothetical protein